MQVKIGIRFHRAEITYFVINRLYAYIKQIICKRIQLWSIKQTISQKLRNLTGNNFSFTPHVRYCSYHHWITTSEAQSLTTQEKHPCPILLEFRHSSAPICKNHKKPEVDKKIQACETITLSKSFIFSSCRCFKQSVSCLLSPKWSELYIRWHCFQICSGNNKSLVLYPCEVIHLINKGVISESVQEQGGRLEFNASLFKAALKLYKKYALHKMGK